MSYDDEPYAWLNGPFHDWRLPSNVNIADMPQYMRRNLFSIAIRWRMSAKETLNLFREMALSDLDPNPVTDGERFVFTRPETIGPDYFADGNAEVPQDTDNVDIFEADAIAERDAKAAATLLQGVRISGIPLDTLWGSVRNAYRWSRFWSVRHWNDDFRKDAAAMAREAEGVMDRLGDKVEDALAKRRAEEGYDAGAAWAEPGILGTAGTDEGQALRRQRIATKRKSQIKIVPTGKKEAS
jgi:hypothetical protein